MNKVEREYVEKQREWVKNFNIKVGDKVKLTRYPTAAECAAQGYSSSILGLVVGASYDVERVAPIGIKVGGFYLPYVILEKLPMSAQPKVVPPVKLESYLVVYTTQRVGESCTNEGNIFIKADGISFKKILAYIRKDCKLADEDTLLIKNIIKEDV